MDAAYLAMANSTPNSGSSPASEWQPIASGNAQLTLSSSVAAGSTLLDMDFDFMGGGGFVVARRSFARPMPEDYAVQFSIRGRAAVNNLEIKLVDAAGQNVWRHVYKDFVPPRRWKRMRLGARDIEFAWGPASGARLASLGSIELAVVAGEGGKGMVSIADLTIVDTTPTEVPRATASSEQAGFEAVHALSGAGWRPRRDDCKPWIVIDWTARRTIGGLIVDWLEHAPPGGFRISSSNTGTRWRTVYAAPGAGGHRSYVSLPDLSSRFLRLEMREANGGASLRVQSFQFSRSVSAFWQAVAAGEERGWHPRWLQNEQTVWTPIGTARGTPSALMNEDGMVEVSPGSWSVEPMVWVHGRLHTWNDVTLRQELEEGWMPVPSSLWEGRDWRLKVQALATVGGRIRIRYEIANLSAQRLSARLFVLVRPFQVTPPWQSFRQFGGVAKIEELSWRDGAVRIGEERLLVPSLPPAGFGALRFDDGFMASHLAAGRLPGATAVRDPTGYACGALAFEISLDPKQSSEHVVTAVSEAERESAIEAPFAWSGETGGVHLSGPGWIADAVDAARASTAYVLVTRAGPALQPGPRRYTRSWIRDGAMMSAALLRMGHAAEVREFIRWYAPYQRADGFVPCCVDRDGPDWLVEHDSHGQLLALVGDYHRFTGDEGLLRECWQHVARAAGYIERVLEPEGLMPVSVSHEGYLAQPVHSFWDDFWTVKGLQEAARLARTIGKPEDAARWAALAGRIASSTFASIEMTRRKRGLDFVPGSIEWADFDPTATANALYLLDVPAGMNRAALERTFDKYLADWRAKRAGGGAWTNYTPYEIRIIGALVRLGRREAALELLRFFLSDRRPVRWNQWPEIAWRDHRTPGHVGDLPHTWIAAEYVLAAHSLFAYERDSAAGNSAQAQDSTLVLAAGLASEWLDGEGVRVAGMPTLHGTLAYTLRKVDADTLTCRIEAGVRGPVVLAPPLDRPLAAVSVDGRPHTDFDARSVNLLQTPAAVTCTMAS
jgi:hypothetical protein